MKAFLDRYPERKNVLNQLVSEMGLSMNVAIYALLKISNTNHETIIVFLFEKDEDTGLMQHEYIS